MKITNRTLTAWNIEWKNDPLPLVVYTHLVKHTYACDDYSSITPARITELLLEVKSSLPHLTYSIEDNVDKLVSARNIILKGKIIKNYGRVNARMQTIIHEYSTNHIMSLSKKYDFPPLSLLHRILSAKYGEGLVHQLASGKKSPDRALDKRDFTEYEIAEQHDAETTSNQRLITEKALENERRFVNYFTSAGIALQTQDDLIKEQHESKVKLTPDILFTDSVHINGKLVKWIDYKDYICTNVNFLFSKNVEQANKYYQRWGEGALCYRLSFVEGITIPHAQLLDGSFTGVDFLT